MKKLVLTTVCVVAISGASFAQGLLTWNNFAGTFSAGTTNATSPFFGGSSAGVVGNAPIGPGVSSAGYYFELLYTTYSGSQMATPTSLSSLFTWGDAGLSATNGPGANGRIVAVNPNLQAAVPWAAGVTDSVMLVGWSANLGTSWLSVSNELNNWATLGIANAYFGASVTGFLTGNTAPANGAIVFASAVSPSANGLPITSINTPLYLVPTTIVPEPATMALAGLGGLSLMLFRRQRKS